MNQFLVIINGICILALTALFLWLSLQVTQFRARNKALLGDAGDKNMAIAIRLHGNFAEYVPIALVLFLIAAVAGTPPLLMTIVLVVFTVSRFLHAFMFGDSEKLGAGRLWGMLGTWASIGVLGLCVFVWSVI